MNDLIRTELFSLLVEDSQEITNEEMQCAYGKFIAHVDTISQVGNDLTRVIRKLNITRAELVFLSAQIQHEQEKKCA
jgi:hypothetical protein